MNTLFRIDMLGGLVVRQRSRDIRRFRTQKTAALLAYLAYFKQRSSPRDVLIELFWPDSTLDAARSNLSVALSALRRQLEEPGVPTGAILIADHAQVHLNPDAYTSDVEETGQFANAAQVESDADKRLTKQIAAVDLYKGDLLPGFYEDWVVTERDRLRDGYLSTLKDVVITCAKTRQYERAIEYSHRMVRADPIREGTYLNLMRLYLAVGRPEDAVYQYEALETHLRKELQTVPSAQLREVAEKIRQAVPFHRPLSTVRATETRPSEAAPSAQHATLGARHPPRVLPFQFTRFFGREAEVARLTQLLRSTTIESPLFLSPSHPLAPSPTDRIARLITLTGPGGSGKTRLSIEVAGQVNEVFAGGIWFVPLSDIADRFLLGETLRDALELPRQTQSPVLDQVIDFLNDRRNPCLLILDNFEQISAGGAPVVWTLLNRVPLLQCLVNSRRPLSLPGEMEVPVLPLPTPVLDIPGSADAVVLAHLLTCPSVALFVDRAQSARSEFQITMRNAADIATICKKLEGIPLAIELAAARARVLTPSQMLDRLGKRFEFLTSERADKGERHKSLWTAIAWSFHLLPAALRRLFARVSVFRGGWSIEASEYVCDEPAALEYLAQLRGHSLISAEESTTSVRFRMLESIREFAAEQLTPEEREEVERRHAAFFHQKVMDEPASGPGQTARLERFEEDLDNLRAVLTWSMRAGNEIELGLMTAARLSSFWHGRGRISEGRRWYDSLLERAGNVQTEGLFWALFRAGMLASTQGDFHGALPLIERCREVALAMGNDESLGHAHHAQGTIAYRLGDYGQARFHYEKSLALARAQGPFHVATELGSLANVALSSGDFASSRALNDESLVIWHDLGDRLGVARTLHNLANLAHSEKRLDEARAYYEQSLEINRELVDSYGISFSLAGLAGISKDQGDYAAAFAYTRESLVLARELNSRIGLVIGLDLLISIVRDIGELEMAARMYRALERAREEMNFPLEPIDQEDYKQTQSALQQSLGTKVYQAARTEGSRMSLQEALVCLERILDGRAL